MPAMREIALVSDDLIFASRLSQALGSCGGRVSGAASGVGPDGVEAVFVDLNQRTEERIAQIVALRAGSPGGTSVGFCHHAENEVRRAAMAASADQVLTNGGLRAGALRVTGLGSGRPLYG